MAKKIILRTLAAVFLLAAIFVVNLVWFKPFFINHFYERVFLEFALDSPETLTSLRLLEPLGINGHNAKLDDASIEHDNIMFAKLQDDFAMLESYSDDGLDEQQLLSKQILAWYLEQQIEGNKFKYHNYPVNQMFGLQSNFPSFMDTFHQVASVEDAEHYVARLEAMRVKFDQAMAGLKVREEKGIIPPTFVIDKVLAEMNGFVAKDAKENILYVSFKAKIEAAEDVTDGERAALLADVEARIKDVVYPAYQSYIDYFTALRESSTSDAGVWKFPDGAAYYQHALRGWNTTDLTPDEIHNVGLSEVARIQAEIVSILGQQGFDTSKGFTPLINELAADERFYFPDTEEGRQQILDGYDTIIAEIDKDMPQYFNRLPKAGVEVRRIPAFKEKTAPGGYYNAPAMDGSRPGMFYANLYDIKATPKYGMRTLAYHEAVPGHHFQIAITQELEGLPMFRNILGFSAYSEGWGLYAEQFAKEVGFLENPFDRVGQLQSELFRSVRLVVDTGIHAKRWTREEAIDYMAKNTGMAMSDVVSEIERYIVMPGQATSYKVGMLEILRLREEAKEQLGNSFDIAEFHDVILKDGAMPLAILRTRVEAYIAEKKAAL